MSEIANQLKNKKRKMKLLENKVTSECYFIIFVVLIIFDIYTRYVLKQDSYFLPLILGLEVYKTLRLCSIGGYDSIKKNGGSSSFLFFIFLCYLYEIPAKYVPVKWDGTFLLVYFTAMVLLTAFYKKFLRYLNRRWKSKWKSKKFHTISHN